MQNPSYHRQKTLLNLNLLLTLVSWTGLLLSLGTFLAEHTIVFDWLSHFRWQAVIALTVVLCISILYRSKLNSLVILLAVAVHGHVLFHTHNMHSIYVDEQQAALSNSLDLRLMSMNASQANRKIDEMLNTIKTESPDVLLVLELTPSLHRELSRLENMQHFAGQPSESAFGIGVYSRFSITDAAIEQLGVALSPTVRAELQINEEMQVTVRGLHPPAPVSAGWWRKRKKQTDALLIVTDDRAGPLIVAGDLNTTPWSGGLWSKFAEKGLYDTRIGYGTGTTWPAGLWPLRIPIDHVLVSNEFSVNDRRVVPVPGSDHDAIVVDLALTTIGLLISTHNY